MDFNTTTTDALFSIEFEDGYATIRIGNHSNRFICCKEYEIILSHMMDVIANSSGLYGTDIVDFECIFERCTNHLFSVYQSRGSAPAESITANSESKAVVLFVIGSDNMGLSDVNHIIEDMAKHYPKETEIIFTAETSSEMSDGCYTLCVLE